METWKVIEIPLQSWPEHIGRVMAVRTAAYEQWNGPQTSQQQEGEGQAWIKKWGQCRDPVLLAAVCSDRMLAYLIGGQREPGELAIGHIGVRPECRRQGIGQRLIESCEDSARQRGCGFVTTSTYNRFRGMLILLLKRGYEIHDLTRIPTSPEPRLLLRKALTDGS